MRHDLPTLPSERLRIRIATAIRALGGELRVIGNDRHLLGTVLRELLLRHELELLRDGVELALAPPAPMPAVKRMPSPDPPSDGAA